MRRPCADGGIDMAWTSLIISGVMAVLRSGCCHRPYDQWRERSSGCLHAAGHDVIRLCGVMPAAAAAAASDGALPGQLPLPNIAMLHS